jgi:hypothetical protein
VLSVHQTDIIVYGRDLQDYLDREFRHPESPTPVDSSHRAIRFWSDLTS